MFGKTLRMIPDWLFVLTFTGFGFGGLLFVHLVTIKRPGYGSKWLAAYILLLSVSLLEFVVAEGSGVLLAIGWVHWLFGPVLYIYTCHRVGKPGSITIWPFLPFMLYGAVLVISLLIPRTWIAADGQLVDVVLYELLFLQIFYYFLLSARTLVWNRHVFKTEVERMKWTFLNILVFTSIALFAGSWSSTHLFVFLRMEVTLVFKASIQVALCILLLIIALLNTESMQARKLVRSRF